MHCSAQSPLDRIASRATLKPALKQRPHMTDLISFLQTRRSVKPKDMSEPGPSPAQIDTILKIAARVPDHGKYNPWYFIVFSGDARIEAGKLIEDAASKEQEGADPKKEAERLLRAPVVIAVVSRIREGKNSQWEQILSAGAACYNLCLAANASGFASNWLTEWIAYSPAFKKSLGIPAEDNIAGLIYLGTMSEKPDERDRPDMARLVTHWSPGTSLNTGAGYGQPGAGLPEKGFN